MFAGRFVSRRLLSRSSSIRCHKQYSTNSITNASVVGFSSYGSPQNVLSIQDQPVPKPGSNEVVVKMLAAPINPADLNLIEGSYGISTKLPAIGGTQGVGIVVEVGSGVKSLNVNDQVISSNPALGTWRTAGVFKQEDLIQVPRDIPKEYSATISNPCTALRLLEDFEKLQPGDVVIQNGANSMVGIALIQIAKARNIKTINIVRNRPDFTATVERLKAFGGFHVVTDEYVKSSQFRTLLSDLPPPKLALNCIGGPTATEMSRVLGTGGAFVTYGGMSRRPVTIPTSAFIFKDIHLHGFWLTKWLEQHSIEEHKQMLDVLFKMIREEKLRLWLETWKFEKFFEALSRHKEQYRDRKIVLVMP